MDNRQKKPDKNNKNSIQMIISILITSILVAVLFNFVVGKWKNGTETEISYGKFVKMIEKKEIKKVVFESDVITVIPKESENPLYKTTYKVVQLPYLIISWSTGWRRQGSKITRQRQRTDLRFS